MNEGPSYGRARNPINTSNLPDLAAGATLHLLQQAQLDEPMSLTRPRRTFIEARMRRGVTMALLAACCLAAPMARAQGQETTPAATEASEAPPEEPKKAPSPWMLLPTFSNNPKLGTSVGALASYLHKFDPQSQVSIFGVHAQYTSTDSATAVVFGRTSFDGDQQRLNVIAIGGRIRNDYDDFLGTGMPLKSDDHIRAFGARYLYRVRGDWFIGAQALTTNYQIVGQTSLDDDLISFLGLRGFEASGIGLVGQHDSRDRPDSPTQGWLLNFNNVAYRPNAEDSDNFSVYRLDYRQFWSHGDGHVLAVRQNNQWTKDAPLGANAPVQLRGYTMGEYLGKSMSSIEVEERHRLAERWTATVFGGVACLYGGDRSGCSKSDLFPSVGAGVQYVLKPDHGIVANLEFAVGKYGNRALLFKMGYGW